LMKLIYILTIFQVLTSSLFAVCAGNSLGACSQSQAQSIPPSVTCAIDAVALTDAAQNAASVKRTSFAQIPVRFNHNGGPTLTYTARLTGLSSADSGTSITESECEGSLTAFFNKAELKTLNISVFQVEINRTIPSQIPLQIVFDNLPPVITIQRVFPGTGIEEGQGLEYSAGTTYFTSQDIFLRARVVDPAPAQDPEKLSVQIISGLSIKPPPVPGDTQNPGSFAFPLNLGSEPEGEYDLRIAGLDSTSELFEDGSPANISDGILLRVVLDKTDPVLTRLELIKNPQTENQTVENIPGVFIKSGRVRVRASFSEKMGRPPTLQIQQQGNGVGTPPDQPLIATFDSQLFDVDPKTVEYEFSPLVGPFDTGPVTFTFLADGTDLAGRPLDLSQGALRGGVVERAVIVDTVPPDLNRIDPSQPGEVRTLPNNNERVAKDRFPTQLTLIVRDYNLPTDIDLGTTGDNALLRQTGDASQVDFSKILDEGSDSADKGIKIELIDPNQAPIVGTLVTQPPNGLIYLLPDLELIYPQGGGLAPEGTYTVRVTLLDKVGNESLETFFFEVDNTDISSESIKVSLLPEADGSEFQADSPNPLLVNPITATAIPETPDLIDLSTLTAVNTLTGFKVCSTDSSFDLTRSLRSVEIKARLNGPDTVARTLNSTGSANLAVQNNTCGSGGEISFTVSADQSKAFPNLQAFPNPSQPGPNIDAGTRDPRFGQFDGPYLVEIRAQDDAGNESNAITKEFLLDTTQPYTEGTFPLDNSKIASPLRHISAVLVDPHPPRVLTFDTTGHVNFGSGISVDRSSLKITLRTPYQNQVLSRSDLFLPDGTLRSKLTFTHVPNSIDPTRPGFNPQDDAFRVLLEFVNSSVNVSALPEDGSADGIYEIEVVPVDNAGNSVNPAVNGDASSGWSQFPQAERRNRPVEVTRSFFFLLDSIAPSLEIDNEPGQPPTETLNVNGRNFGLSGKTRDLSARGEAGKGGSGIDRVEFEVVYQTMDGELVPEVAGSQTTNPKRNPILTGQLANLSPILDSSRDPHTSSTRPMDPSSYNNIELEERSFTIQGLFPPQNEVIGAADNTSGKQANYFLRIYSYDLAGNKTRETLQLNLQFGTIPGPDLLKPEFNEYFTRGVVSFEWRPVSNATEYILHISEPGGVESTHSVLPNGSNNPIFQKVFSREGEYQWFVVARDSVGNDGTASIPRKFFMDRTAPAIELLTWLDPSPESSGRFTIGQFRLQIRFTERLENAPEVSFRPFLASLSKQVVVTDHFSGEIWEGIATVPATATASWDGIATLEVARAVDLAGNLMVEDRSHRFEIDTGPSYEVKFFENPVFQTEVVFVIRSSERLALPPVLFSPQGVTVISNTLVKIGDQSYSAILKLGSLGSLREGKIQITGTDLLGNASTRSVVFPLSQVAPSGGASLSSSRLSLSIPEGGAIPGKSIAIFPRDEIVSDISDSLVSKSRSTTGLKRIKGLEVLHPSNLVLSLPASISLDLGSKLKPHQGIFLETSTGLKFLKAQDMKSRQALFKTTGFGKLAIYEDRIAPIIELPEIEDSLYLQSRNPQIDFTVRDLQSGVEPGSIAVRLGQKELQIQSGENGQVRASYAGFLARGTHSLEVSAQDNLGNKTQVRSAVLVAGPIRLQARTYPNPARDFVVIRYNLSRGAKRVNLRIYDAADSLVFSSSSENDLDLTLNRNANAFEWNLESTEGQMVSNGVYICQVQVWDHQGHWDRTRMKIAVLR
jgi:hypothetical protein